MGSILVVLIVACPAAQSFSAALQLCTACRFGSAVLLRDAKPASERRPGTVPPPILLRDSAGPSFVSVTSTSNGFAKRLVRLRDQARFRRSEGCAVVVGSAPIRELCAPGGPASAKLQSLLLLEEEDGDSWHAEFLQALATTPKAVYIASSAVFHKVAGLESAEGRQACAEIALPHMLSVSDLLSLGEAKRPPALLVLDRIQDPGNVGTLLRTAAGLGWSTVLLDGCCDIFNDKVIRAARGAAWRAPVAASSWEAFEQSLDAAAADAATPSSVFVADMGGVHPYTAREHHASRQGPLVLLLSNEGAGVSAEVRARMVRSSGGGGGAAEEAADSSKVAWLAVGVPLIGDMESLNVGVAGSILMFALREHPHVC